MLATDEKRLRWWGMDMRPRWRRRVAVVAAYAGFAVVMGVTLDSTSDQHPVQAVVGMVVLTMIWKWASILRGNGVVKSFEEPPKSARRMLVNGLDGWARYRYGVENFEAASEEQQADLLKRYRFGTFFVPAKDSAKLLDERERGERDSATRWALQKIAIWVAIPVGIYVSRAARHAGIDPMEIVANFWILSLLAQTLPQVRVLWTEPDPREAVGEMELVAERG